jgi:hypothetical protein
VRVQPHQPAELVVELRSGCGIAVRRLEAADQHAAHGSLDVARLLVLVVTRQAPLRQNGFSVPGEDGQGSRCASLPRDAVSAPEPTLASFKPTTVRAFLALRLLFPQGLRESSNPDRPVQLSPEDKDQSGEIEEVEARDDTGETSVVARVVREPAEVE